jgi:hypothetical protein
MARFSSSLIPAQQAISSIVRRHPSHSPVDESIRQMLMQGEMTGMSNGEFIG